MPGEGGRRGTDGEEGGKRDFVAEKKKKDL